MAGEETTEKVVPADHILLNDKSCLVMGKVAGAPHRKVALQKLASDATMQETMEVWESL